MDIWVRVFFSVMVFLSFGDCWAASPTQQRFKCVGAVKTEFKLRATTKTLEEKLSQLEAQEWSRHEKGFRPLWVLPQLLFKYKKLFFRWRNHKGLNYAYLDDYRIQGEIFANPSLNAALTKQKAKWDNARDLVPEKHFVSQQEKSLEASREYHKALTSVVDNKALFGLLANGWWGPRKSIKGLITDIDSYEARINQKVREGASVKVNESILLQALLRHWRSRHFPMLVDLVEYQEDGIRIYQEPFDSRLQMIRRWIELHKKRKRIFPAFFNKGELGDLEENYAQKWARLRSMAARLVKYEGEGALAEKVQKRLNQIRDLENKGLPHPTYMAEFWLDQVIGQTEASLFFKGRSIKTLRNELDGGLGRVMAPASVDELIRELEINNLASFWGRVRNKALLTLLATGVPITLTVDGVAETFVDYGKAAWNHMRSFGQGFLEINQRVDSMELESSDQKVVDQKEIVVREMRLIHLAGLKSESLFQRKIIVFMEGQLGRVLTAKERMAVILEFEKKEVGIQQESGRLALPLGDEALVSLVTEITRIRADIQEKQEALGEGVELYLEELLQTRIGERILKLNF